MGQAVVIEDSGRVLMLALALWAGAAALAAWDGVFAVLGIEMVAALAAFATTYALAAYALDAAMRRHLHRGGAPVLAVIALVLDAAVTSCVLAVWRGNLALDALAGFPGALLPLFVVPLGVVATVAALRAGNSSRRAHGHAMTSVVRSVHP